MFLRWLGCKAAIAVSFIAYMPFIAAQFYPKLYALVPAGMMVGFGGGPLWCAKCTYLSVVSAKLLIVYSVLNGIHRNRIGANVEIWLGKVAMVYHYQAQM